MIGKRRLAASAAVLSVLAALVPQTVFAHDVTREDSGAFLDALGVWRLEPLETVLVLFAAIAYAWAYRRLRRVAPEFHFSRWHPVAFGGGVLVLLGALNSPIDTYSDELFWVHMVQHMIMVMLAAPLLLFGAPVTLALRVATPRVRHAYLTPLLHSRFARMLTYSPWVLVLFTAAIWIWHLPALYESAIEQSWVHFLEHAVFLTVALLFWWLAIGVDATQHRPPYMGRVAILVIAILQQIALALFLSSVGDPSFEPYVVAAAVRDWGPTALTDQRIGAGVMWVPGTMMLALAIILNLYYWAEHEEFEGRRGDMLRARRGTDGGPVDYAQQRMEKMKRGPR